MELEDSTNTIRYLLHYNMNSKTTYTVQEQIKLQKMNRIPALDLIGLTFIHLETLPGAKLVNHTSIKEEKPAQYRGIRDHN